MRTVTIGVSVCIALALPRATRAATFAVNTTDDAVDATPGDGVCAAPNGKCTLRAAILEANALAGADTIALPAGRYVLSIRGTGEDAGATGDLDITDDLAIIGAEEPFCIISGNHIDRVFDVHDPAHVTLANLTITQGEAPLEMDAGGMLNTGTVTLSHVTFLRNRAGRNEGAAGGLKNSGTATLMDVTFLQNRAADAYGNSYSFSGSAGDVGGMWNEGTATLNDVIFRANRAGDGSKNPFAGNDGGSVGGLLNEGDATLSDVTFSINRAGDGGGGGVGGFNGGMENDGTATLSRVTFQRNRAGDGGTVGYGDGGDGGGMGNSGGAILTDVGFISNRAGRSGLSTSGGYGGNGGGMESSGTAQLTRATFDRNRAGGARWGIAGSGGGIIVDQGTATLTNVTITGNNAGDGRGYAGGEGGGVSLTDGSATLTNVTLALNHAGKGRYNAGSYQIAGFATVTNSIIFGRRSCDGYYTELVSMGHNLDSGTTCGLTAAGDLSNVNPRLDALKSNGGFTQTMALRAGSPAIDAGDNALCPATDQRGIARPQGAACDIGAYELQP